MKVLFICSGNSKNFKITPFIEAQADSLRVAGVEIDYFTITEKGFSGYLKSVKKLKKFLKNQDYDLIHAHFVLSGWVAVLGSSNLPIVLSLMGTDVLGEHIGNKKIKFKSRLYTMLSLLIQPFVDRIISKSSNIEKYVYFKSKSQIIPNGINLNSFFPDPEIKNNSNELFLTGDRKKKVLFLGSKTKKVKNFSLALNAINKLNRPDIELVNPYPLSHFLVPGYLNAADVVLLTSFMEGSPNVIKEAMACSRPIVATDVGDVKLVLGDLDGCFISSFEVEEFSEKIEKALEFSESIGLTKGFERIIHLGLDSQSISKKIIKVYEEVCHKSIIDVKLLEEKNA